MTSLRALAQPFRDEPQQRLSLVNRGQRKSSEEQRPCSGTQCKALEEANEYNSAR